MYDWNVPVTLTEPRQGTTRHTFKASGATEADAREHAAAILAQLRGIGYPEGTVGDPERTNAPTFSDPRER